MSDRFMPNVTVDLITAECASEVALVTLDELEAMLARLPAVGARIAEALAAMSPAQRCAHDEFLDEVWAGWN